ncbi:MAG: alpha/beta hydrolase [Acidimicrobiia bacterium]|nr:alpha/beta hydrolase [Acidimicrobiia bacterium]
MNKRRCSIWLVAALVLGAAPLARGQTLPDRFVQVAGSYRVVSNVTYLTANNYESKLDLYVPRADGPRPVLMYIHGGGWTQGSKESSALTPLPFLEMGWAVVNVEYRLARVSLAPAAVEDCRCALRWIYRNAKEFNFDLDRIVVTGHSSGGHLALTTGMLSSRDGLDYLCPGDRGPGPVNTDEMKVAAMVSWYGITDVAELLSGPSRRAYAEAWLGNLPDREALAKRVSPLSYVRSGLPPTLLIHGDADPVVPYSQAVRMSQALERAGVPQEMVTVPGGGHGGFSDQENIRIYAAIRAFLARHQLGRNSSDD